MLSTCDAMHNYHLPLQITYGVLFSLVITFVSDALSNSHEKTSLPSSDSSFRHEFHELVSFLKICLNLHIKLIYVGTYSKIYAHCKLGLL